MEFIDPATVEAVAQTVEYSQRLAHVSAERVRLTEACVRYCAAVIVASEHAVTKAQPLLARAQRQLARHTAAQSPWSRARIYPR